MSLPAADLDEFVSVAITAATEAGEFVARSRPQHIEHKPDAPNPAAQVVTEVDRQSEQIILDHLTPTLEPFGLGLLTEERNDDGSRLDRDHFWCVDPLDGTLPFVEGIAGHAVSIALVGQGGTPMLGVVYDPVESTLVHAIRTGGAFRDGAMWTADESPQSEVLSVHADRSFLTHPDYDQTMAGLHSIALDRGLADVVVHATAGAVMNALAVVENPTACYFKYPARSGGGSLWDFAATACVFAELGAVATDMYGAPLDLNRSDSTFMHHRGVLFASDETLARDIRALRPMTPH